MKLPLKITFYIAKLSQFAVKRLGKGGGSALPGLIAIKLNQKLLPVLAKQLHGTIVVAGTNGKTTTSRLVSSFLEGADYKVVHNRTGSNLLRGLASTLIKQADWHMTIKADWAVFEVDEAVLPQALDILKPDYVLALNLFRDQLDRYGEINTLALKWQQACRRLPKTSTLVINADDPLINSLSLDTQAKVVAYSLHSGSAGQKNLSLAPHADSRRCPVCGRSLIFSAINYSHLGQYTCPAGDYQPYPATIIASKIKLDGMVGSSFAVQYGEQDLSYQLSLAGLYNIYNALAAISLGLVLELNPAMLVQRTKNFEAVFGRLEQVQLGQTVLTMILVKNPTGYNQVLQTLATDQAAKSFWLLLNDHFADGRDVSWIWDVELERLVSQADQVTVSGTRAVDLAVRLKYADLPASSLQLTRTLTEGLRRISSSKQQHIYCLCTYTAMLELRKLLQKQKLVKAYYHE